MNYEPGANIPQRWLEQYRSQRHLAENGLNRNPIERILRFFDDAAEGFLCIARWVGLTLFLLVALVAYKYLAHRTIRSAETTQPTAGVGYGILFNIDSSKTADQNAAQTTSVWTTAAPATTARELSALSSGLATSTAAAASLTLVIPTSPVTLEPPRHKRTKSR